MFLQIHTLTSHHASLLNRDDAGLAKRIPFGNATRLRISSQCLKRHWRTALHQNLSLPGAMRSRQFFAREVFPRLLESGVNPALARRLTRRLIEKLMDGGTEEGESLVLKQAVLFGKPEADYLVALLEQCVSAGDEPVALAYLETHFKSEKRNLKAMLKQAGYGNLFAGIEGALFGRFVTSDILSRSDAPVHVAHAFTVHALDTEVDYFTAVDELKQMGEAGAAHAGDMELGTGIFYGYVVVDIPLLVSNFTGCDRKNWAEQDSEMVQVVLRQLICAIATVTPGAKLGATAPYAYSDLVLLEVGKQQPRSLANAYLQAIPIHGNLMQHSLDRLAEYRQALENIYGSTCDHYAICSMWDWGDLRAERHSLDEAITRILSTVFRESRNAGSIAAS